MRALTLQQPFATLIAIGAKHIETRSWSTSYRGPLAIHAGKAQPNGRVLLDHPFLDVLGTTDWTRFPLGAVVATCRLVDVVPTENLIHEPTAGLAEPWGKGTYIVDMDHERAFGDFTPGRYAWLVDGIEPLDPPVRAKGRQGLWTWDYPGGER